MSFTSSYVMAGIGTFFILFWLFLYIKYRNAYDQVIDAIDKKKFMFGEIYFIGFGFITLFHINIKTERGSKKIKEISEIYGRKYAEFYHYVITGGSISYFLTLLPMGFCLGAIANNVMLGVLGVVASALLLEYMSGEIKKNVNERREDILEDLPQMLSKFTLLINAGLIVRDVEYMKYRGVVAVSQELINKFSGFSGFDKQSKAIKAKMNYEKELEKVGDSCQTAYNELYEARKQKHTSVTQDILGYEIEADCENKIELFKDAYLKTVSLAKENYDNISKYLVYIKVLEDTSADKLNVNSNVTVNGEESYSLNFDGDGSSTDRLVYNGFIGY